MHVASYNNRIICSPARGNLNTFQRDRLFFPLLTELRYLEIRGFPAIQRYGYASPRRHMASTTKIILNNAQPPGPEVYLSEVKVMIVLPPQVFRA